MSNVFVRMLLNKGNMFYMLIRRSMFTTSSVVKRVYGDDMKCTDVMKVANYGINQTDKKINPKRKIKEVLGFGVMCL